MPSRPQDHRKSALFRRERAYPVRQGRRKFPPRTARRRWSRPRRSSPSDRKRRSNDKTPPPLPFPLRQKTQDRAQRVFHPNPARSSRNGSGVRGWQDNGSHRFPCRSRRSPHPMRLPAHPNTKASRRRREHTANRMGIAPLPRPPPPQRKERGCPERIPRIGFPTPPHLSRSSAKQCRIRPGLGKTTISMIIAKELGVGCKSMKPLTVER